MTAYAEGQSLTTRYVLDNGQVLAASTGGSSTFYLYGHGPLAELTDAWAYPLIDGSRTARQLVDVAGNVVLASSFTPWGDTLSVSGSGSFTTGYFGGIMDSATGLLYVGNGQYYDPATGRFLNCNARPNQANPYVPWSGDPLGALMAPLAVMTVVLGRKKKHGKWETTIALVVLGSSVAIITTAFSPIQTNISIEPDRPVPVIQLNLAGTVGSTIRPKPVEPPNKPITTGCVDAQYTGSVLADYNEKIPPVGITFTGEPLSSPLIYDYTGKLVLPGTNQSQFIWIASTFHTGLCGLVSLTAELTRVHPISTSPISVNTVLGIWSRRYGNTSPDYIGLGAIADFIEDTIFINDLQYSGKRFNYVLGDSFGNNNNKYNTFKIRTPNDLAIILGNGDHLIAGVKINGNEGNLTHGLIKNGSGSADHWIVITGISAQWSDEPYENKVKRSTNWIRIYNPFDNKSEYYWWGDFWRSWTSSGNSGLTGYSLQLRPKRAPCGMGIPDCR